MWRWYRYTSQIGDLWVDELASVQPVSSFQATVSVIAGEYWFSSIALQLKKLTSRRMRKCSRLQAFQLRIWLRRTDAFSFCACSHGMLKNLTSYFLGYAINTCLISLRPLCYIKLSFSHRNKVQDHEVQQDVKWFASDLTVYVDADYLSLSYRAQRATLSSCEHSSLQRVLARRDQCLA